MRAWQTLEAEYEQTRERTGQLWKASRNLRCPFVLAWNGRPVANGYAPELQCIKDRHDDGEHELSSTAWVETEI